MLEGNNNMKSYQTILGMPIGMQWIAYFSQGDTYRDASRPVNQPILTGIKDSNSGSW